MSKEVGPGSGVGDWSGVEVGVRKERPPWSRGILDEPPYDSLPKGSNLSPRNPLVAEDRHPVFHGRTVGSE